MVAKAPQGLRSMHTMVSLLTPKPSEESMVARERRLTEGGTAGVPEEA